MSVKPRTLAAAAAALTLTTAAVAAAFLQSAPASAAGLSPFDITGRGATVPFIEHEAEEAVHNGTRIGPDRIYGRLPSEASGREAVTLDAAGEFVEFTLTAPANAVTFRYSLPDNAAGTGRDATIDLRVGSQTPKAVPVTSKYGWYYGGYPFNNNPGDINPHHFYDEARATFASTAPAGTKVRLQVTSTAQSPTFTIDLADFELVGAAGTMPAGAINVVTDFGADPTGATDNTARLQQAVDAGRTQGRVVWIPPGNYTVYDHVILDQVTVRGAGPWYTVLSGRHPTDRWKAVGLYGKWAEQGGSRNVTVRDLAIIGDIRERVDNDQVNAFGGALSDSVIDNVWMQHTKVGAWMDGPMNNLTIRNCRILDQTADGVNFHKGVTNSTVTNTFVRNTGDDGLAMWAQDVPNVNNSFTFNTVGVTILANNIVTYGGQDIRITDNVTADSVTNGGGIHVANRFPGVNGPTAVRGTITVARNTLIRNGNNDFNWRFGVGAIWFSGLNEPITQATINVTDTDILDSSYAALHWIEGATNGLNFNNVRIDGAGTYALQVQAPGQASFTNVRATGIAQANPIHNCIGSGFQITQGAGNSGWFTPTPVCTGTWPDPDWTRGPSTPPSSQPPVGALSADPAFLAFGQQNLNTTSAARAVTVRNTGSAPVALSGVTVNGDFAQSNTCPGTLAAGATCTANVTFRPTATGNRTGTLTVASNAAPLTVALSGTGFDPAGNLAAGRPVTVTSANGPYVAGNAVDADANSYWESANNAFPQSITVDLGSVQSVGRMVLKLPPPAAWQTRTQTLSVLGSTDGSSFSTIVGSTGYTFNPAAGNSVTINLPAGTRRYVRLTFTANTGWPAAQLSEFEVYAGGGTGGPALVVSPSSLSFGSRPVGTGGPAQPVTVSNTGTAAAALSAITASGDFAQTNNCGTALAAGASCTVNVTFTPTAAGARTGTLSIVSNAPGSPHTAALTGSGGTPAGTNLAAGRPVTATGFADVYGPGNAVDGNANSYWESANNAFPQSITVDLGASVSVARVVVKLPPAAAWQTRTQTLSVLGSTDGSSYSTVLGPAGYTFNPATGNTVTITFPATTRRYLRLTFTANTGWPAGQVGEWEVYAS
jgi:hypothetical protein